MKLDEYTEQHLQKWLDETQASKTRLTVETHIKKLVHNDPGLLNNHSWPELERMV